MVREGFADALESRYRDVSARGHLNKTRTALAAGAKVMETREADRLPLPSDPYVAAPSSTLIYSPDTSSPTAAST